LDDINENDDDDNIECLEENLRFNINTDNKDDCYKLTDQKITII
jgi:hypothetical protein